MDTEVVIAGAGPTGLMLACELHLAGVRPVVLERLAEPTGLSKALTLLGRSVDVVDGRGLLGRFQDRAAPGIPPAAHFGLIPLDLAAAGEIGLRGLWIQQAATEQVLNEYAGELGVEIRRGHQLAAVRQDAGGVRIQVSGPRGDYELRAGYLVGCDGGASVVRRQAGIEFPGLGPALVLRLGDVTLDQGVTPGGLPGVRVPLVPLGSGFYRVITTEPYPPGLDRDAPMTLEELRASVRRATGQDLPISGARWVSRFTDASRQAAAYRVGGVLLAGDAAHIHLPAGGPGLNTGLLDAVNLGWKLAAEVRGWAPSGLLDSYHTERHAEGARVLLHTRAQGALVGSGADGRLAALRDILAQLLSYQQPLCHLLRLMYALDTRYDTGTADPHPLAGRWAPNLPLTTATAAAATVAAATVAATTVAATTVIELLRPARGVLLDLTAAGTFAAAGHGWEDRVDILTAQSPDPPAPALLIRPDGYVAWAAAPDAPQAGGLRRALTTWFGAPAGG